MVRSFQAFLIPNPVVWESPDGFWPAKVGMDWLRQQPGPRAVVVPTQARAKELDPLPPNTEVVTPRARSGAGRRPSVLVCFAVDPALIEIGEQLSPEALCVADFGSDAVRAWSVKHDPTELVPHGWVGEIEPPAVVAVPADALTIIEGLVMFDGHNQFRGSGGKETAIRVLRRIHLAYPQIDEDEFERWLLTIDGIRPGGAKQLAEWFAQIGRGVRHLDYARRPI